MAILDYNEIKPRKTILHEEQPWEVLDSQVSRKQQGKPFNRVRMRNLNNGQVVDWTFHATDRAPEADMEKETLVYLYSNEKKGEFWFNKESDPKDRFTLEARIVGDGIKYIPEKTAVEALVFTNDEGERAIIGVSYPIKIALRVTDAPPSTKGDTATGGKKNVIVETGASVVAPLFINEGDVIMVNTDTGEYTERAEKA